jgi:aerobic C4-dicarboxylate transport protein
MVLVLGIDRFMSEARAITNLFGNTVATIFVARWEGSLDIDRARAILDRREGVEDLVLAE